MDIALLSFSLHYGFSVTLCEPYTEPINKVVCPRQQVLDWSGELEAQWLRVIVVVVEGLV